MNYWEDLHPPLHPREHRIREAARAVRDVFQIQDEMRERL